VNETVLTICGNVATPVRFVRTEHDLAIASFRIASTDRRFDRNSGWVDGETNFLTVTCFRALAENVASSVAKGQPVIVTGRLRVRTWKKEERQGLSVEVEASGVGHDLARGTSMFRRAERPAAAATPGRPEADELVVGLESEDLVDEEEIDGQAEHGDQASDGAVAA
jgi:single-strand DNA-binding protein